MKRSQMLALALFTFVYGNAAAAGAQCGGTAASIGMPLGIVKMPGARPHVRSLEMFSAVVDKKGRVAGWLGYDDLGTPWIQFAESPSTFKSAVQRQVVNLGGTGLFSPLRLPWTTLPAPYRLEACRFIDAGRSSP